MALISIIALEKSTRVPLKMSMPLMHISFGRGNVHGGDGGSEGNGGSIGSGGREPHAASFWPELHSSFFFCAHRDRHLRRRLHAPPTHAPSSFGRHGACGRAAAQLSCAPHVSQHRRGKCEGVEEYARPLISIQDLNSLT
jgi:hypothetical protein